VAVLLALLLGLVAWLVFKSLVAVLIALAILAVALYIDRGSSLL